MIVQAITVAVSDLQLPGRYARPEGRDPVPAVVLLHPWGAWDLDGTLPPSLSATGEPIHLFRQLEQALVGAGVAVVRFDSRFALCRGKSDPLFERLTWHNAVDDAREAVAMARRLPGVDPEQVWLLGISLGTDVAVAVSETDERLAGLILMAAIGNSYALRAHYVNVERKLEWLWRSGLVDTAGNVDLTALGARETERWGWWDLEPDLAAGGSLSVEQVAAVLEAGHQELMASALAGKHPEAPAAWWQQWAAVRPAYERLRPFKAPVLILQGEDENTTPLREAHLLARASSRARLRTFRELGHLFSARRADGRRTYGPLDDEVLAFLAEFFQRTRG